MKKILAFFTLFLVLAGCSLSEIDNTPTKKVEAFFNNYQTLDQDVLDDLDVVIAKETNFTTEQKETYRDILKKHYQNLTYEIKGETVNGNKATVEVEIEVTDFYKVMNNSEQDISDNYDDLLGEGSNYDQSKYIDYRLSLLKNAKDTVKYTLNLTLTKNNDGDWVLDDLDDIEEQKILGMYQY